MPALTFRRSATPKTDNKGTKAQMGYLVELHSGRSITAKEVRIDGAVATLVVKDGREMKIAESSIKTLKLYKL